MHRQGCQSPSANSIGKAGQSMGATVEILTGVASTGKSARLLAAYRAALDEARRVEELGRTLWLAPTDRARRAVLTALVDQSHSVCFAPNVFTFDAFAEKILQASDANVAPLSDVAKRTLLRRIVDRLLQRKQLPYFTPIAKTSGFLDLVIRFISELKRDEIWPEHFIEACRARHETPKDRELALIYQQYQDQLLQLSLYDAEGRFWSARAVLASDQHGPFDRFSYVVADGFTDFTHTQYEILEHLAQRADRMSISLPLESPLIRDELFAKTAAARDRIQSMSASGLKITVRNQTRKSGSGSAAFNHIADHLFANPRDVRRFSDAGGIEIVAVTGQMGEVQMLAQRVKRLLLAGVSTDDIVIALRTLDDYADLIHEVFAASGIPYWSEAGSPLLRAPLLRALFAVIQLELEDWPFERLLGVLDSNYFRPHWDEWREGEAVRHLAALLRRWKLHSHRSSMLGMLKRQAERESAPTEPSGQSESEETDAETVDAGIAFGLLEKLSLATENLRHKSDFTGWVEVLVSLARELGIAPHQQQSPGPADEAPLADREARLWDRFERILFDAVQADNLLEDASKTLSLDEFATRLTELLRPQAVPPDGSERGRVRVLEAAQIRNLDVPHLFLAGLTENSFPRHQNDDCLYGEAERRQLNEHGLTLGHLAARSQEEMLMFYGVVTRARKRLVLSYPAISAAGEPLFPTPYLRALTDLFEPDALPTTSVTQLDPVPEPDRILTPADLRTVATLEVRKDRPNLFRAMCEAPGSADSARNLLASVDMAVERFHTSGFTRYEGRLSHPENHKSLERRYSSEYEFSATQLEGYATCPFRFLCSDVLKIEPLDSPETVTDYRRRGILVHDVLAAIHQPSADADLEPLGLSKEEITDRFREQIEQQLDQLPTVTKLQQALIRIEGELLAEWASAYADQWGDYLSVFGDAWDAAPSPVHLEQAFGDVPVQADDANARSLDSVVFGTGEKQTRVRGRLDRIDVGTVEGRSVYNVIDYKTGKLPRFSLHDVESGRAIQLVLYTLAARRLSLVDSEATPFQMGYWSIKENGFARGLKGRAKAKIEPLDAVVLESLEAVLEQLIPKLAAGIRSGNFPVYNHDQKCTGSCAYSTICRVNQIRPLETKLHKVFEL